MAEVQAYENNKYVLLEGSDYTRLMIQNAVIKGRSFDLVDIHRDIHSTSDVAKKSLLEVETAEEDITQVLAVEKISRNPLEVVMTETTTITFQGPYLEFLKSVLDILIKEDPVVIDRGIAIHLNPGKDPGSPRIDVTGPWRLIKRLRAVVLQCLKIRIPPEMLHKELLEEMASQAINKCDEIDDTSYTSQATSMTAGGEVNSTTKSEFTSTTTSEFTSANKAEPLHQRASKDTQTEVDVSDIGIQCPSVKEKELGPIAINQPGGSTSDTDSVECNTKPGMHKNATSSYSLPKLVEFPLQKNKHKLVFANSHFLYEYADIKIVALSTELGFSEPATKDLDKQLKGSLQLTISRRYQNGKPDKFDVFTVHCPPSTIGCRFLVVANILDRNVKRGHEKFLQQILHNVFKEADTLELPKALVSPDSFRSLGFPPHVLLPPFIRMLSQYHFTNDEFLTEVKFLAASQNDLTNLVTIAESTLGTKGLGKNDNPAVGSLLELQNSEKEHDNQNAVSRSSVTPATDLDPLVVQLMYKQGILRSQFLKYKEDFTQVTAVGINAGQHLQDFRSSYKDMKSKVVKQTFSLSAPLQRDSVITELLKLFPSVAFSPDVDDVKCVHVLSADQSSVSAVKAHLQKCLPLPQHSHGSEVVIQMANQRTILVKKGDLVKEEVTAIVNAANEHLTHGAGVASAIDSASHGQVQRESKQFLRNHKVDHIPTGHVAITGAGGKLRCRYIIHAVGPDASVFKMDECKHLLQQACENTLVIAESNNMVSVAFPPISSGIFGMPKDLVAQILIDTMYQFPYKPDSTLKDVRIVIIDNKTLLPFLQHAQRITDSCHTLPQDRSSSKQPPFQGDSQTPSWDLVEIPMKKSHHKVVAKKSRFLYEDADIKIVAICSTKGFTEGINKDINDQLNGLLQQTVDRRYQYSVPDKFDVFTVHCKSSAIRCRFLVVANILECTLPHQDCHKHLQQILHSVFKEADTLEMPTVVIAPNTFTVGNFPKDIVLPTFIEMFNQYKFTNDEFLTDIRFVAATDDDFLQLLTTAERTLGKSLRTPVQEEPVQTEASVERKEPQSFSLLSSLGSVASSVSSKFPSPWSFFQSRPTVSPRQAESVAISLGANCTLTVKLGNIVDEDAVAIVSPSNSQLEPTTAISAAIFDASCGNVQKDSLASMRRRGGPVLTGRVAVTEAGGKLLCKNIIHVVAPKRDQFTVERCQELLKYAVKNILECAEGRQIPSIALPPLFPDRSTVPTDQAVQHLIDAILHYPHNPNSSLKDIRIIISDENMLQPFLDQAQRVVHSMESLLSGATTPPPQNPPPTSPKPEVPQKAPSGVPSPRSESNIMEIPLGKSNRRLTIRQQHFLYENTDIKIAAICSEMGFTKGINKNLNNALKGLLQETVDRRYTNGKPGKFDVFTVHCPPATANCRFLVVANILDRNLGEQEDHRFLQQILHSVFKEADTLEMPSVAIVPNTFAVGGFSRDSILPAFIRMFNQYHFTNDEFLTDVRFLASNEEGIQNLCSILGLSGPSSKNRSPQVNISARFNKEGSPAATLVTGDISSIVADVIVVPVNPSLDLRGETSKAVNMASGKALSKSLSSLKGKLSEGMISPVSCDQWDIPAKYLLLLCRSPSTRMDVLKKGCRKALDTAKSLGLRSIAFPPITSHQGKEELAKAMVEVFKSFQDGDQNQMSIMVVLKKNDSNQASFKSILDRHYWESKV